MPLALLATRRCPPHCTRHSAHSSSRQANHTKSHCRISVQVARCLDEEGSCIALPEFSALSSKFSKTREHLTAVCLLLSATILVRRISSTVCQSAFFQIFNFPTDGPKIARDASIIQCGKGLEHEGVLCVCGRCVDSNSIQCTGTSCQKWVHKKCSGIKGSMYKVMKSFICRGCSNPVISTGHTSGYWCQCISGGSG